MLTWVEHEKSFITSGPGVCLRCLAYFLQSNVNVKDYIEFEMLLKKGYTPQTHNNHFIVLEMQNKV